MGGEDGQGLRERKPQQSEAGAPNGDERIKKSPGKTYGRTPDGTGETSTSPESRTLSQIWK